MTERVEGLVGQIAEAGKSMRNAREAIRLAQGTELIAAQVYAFETGRLFIRRFALPLGLALGIAGSSAGIVPAPTASAQASPVAGTPATVAADDGVTITGQVASPGVVTLADLQTLPTETIEATYESNATPGVPETHTFTGVRLIDVLNTVGLAGDSADSVSRLRLYLVLTAKDGYQVVLSVGELDPYLGDAPMLLAWERDDAPLMSTEAPLQLVVPGDLRDSRYIWGIVSIEVRSVSDSGSA